MSLFKDLQWHSISYRMKSRFLPTGSNCCSLTLSFSPAYLGLLFISSSISTPNPPSPNRFLLPLLFFISLVTFFTQCSTQLTLIEQGYASQHALCQLVRTHSSIIRLSHIPHLTCLVIFTSVHTLSLDALH